MGELNFVLQRQSKPSHHGDTQHTEHMSNNRPLDNQWVIITGASSGFGAAAAQLFSKAGAKLILGARRLEKLQQLATAIEQETGGEVHPFFLDVSSTASVEEFVVNTRKLTQQLHILINNAGGAHGLDPVAKARDEDWEAMFQSNVLGVLRMCRACIPLLTATPGSSIINIGSVAGHTAYEGGAAYCAAKAGELQITRSLRLELNGTGVRVSTIDPGLAETEFSIVRFKGDKERAAKVYQGVTPLTAEDVAETMLWVATRPPHVCIDEMIIKPTDQASVFKIHRRSQ
jgi:NADP-dependent 3-hydroxy acid dehydrogenase YdfG